MHCFTADFLPEKNDGQNKEKCGHVHEKSELEEHKINRPSLHEKQEKAHNSKSEKSRNLN